MPTVYIETSIVSYLRQRPSSQIVMAARQLLTHKWWNEERGDYDLVTSQYVLDEAAQGDPVLAAERLQSLSVDALHIATVAHHRIEYLLTWNCRHIANAKILPRVRKILDARGIPVPIICTPEELLAYAPEEE